MDNLGKLCLKKVITEQVTIPLEVRYIEVYNTQSGVSHIARIASDIFKRFQWEREQTWLSIVN
jgi:hypothetical protein